MLRNFKQRKHTVSGLISSDNIYSKQIENGTPHSLSLKKKLTVVLEYWEMQRCQYWLIVILLLKCPLKKYNIKTCLYNNKWRVRFSQPVIFLFLHSSAAIARGSVFFLARSTATSTTFLCNNKLENTSFFLFKPKLFYYFFLRIHDIKRMKKKLQIALKFDTFAISSGCGRRRATFKSRSGSRRTSVRIIG